MRPSFILSSPKQMLICPSSRTQPIIRQPAWWISLTPVKFVLCILLVLAPTPLGIREVSPIANHVITLTGDGAAAIPPQVLTVPKEMADPLEICIPSEPEFNIKILQTSRYPLFCNADVPETVLTPKIMPIIIFLVYDSFDQDLDAVVVYERVKTYTTSSSVFPRSAEISAPMHNQKE